MLKFVRGSGQVFRREGWLGLAMTLVRNIFWVNAQKMETGTAGCQLIKSPWERYVWALEIPSVCIHNCDHFSSSSQVFFAKDDIVESASTKIEKQIFFLIYYRNQGTWSPLGKHLLWQDCVPIVGISCLSIVFVYASLWCSVNSHVLFRLSALVL